MDMSKFAYSTHAKALTELRALQSSPTEEFLLKHQILEEVIIDFAPPIPDHILRNYKCPNDQLDGKKTYKEKSHDTNTSKQSCQDENNTEE